MTKQYLAWVQGSSWWQLLVFKVETGVFNKQSVLSEWETQRFLKIYLSIHWAARQAAVNISLMWVSQLDASSLLSQRSMLCDWSLQASTSLMRLSCRMLNLWEMQNITENVSSNITIRTTCLTDLKIKHYDLYIATSNWPCVEVISPHTANLLLLVMLHCC